VNRDGVQIGDTNLDGSVTIILQPTKNKQGGTKMNLQDLLGQLQGEEALSKISETVGADPGSVDSAVQAALPQILGGLATNASTPEGAQSLDNALTNDHDGSLLNDINGLDGKVFGSPDAGPPPREADAGGILGHVLGDQQGQVAQQVSNESGLGMGQVSQVLMMLAPVVMASLGQQKAQQGVGADGLSDMLGGLMGGAQPQAGAPSSGGSMMDMASSMLDSNKDGSITDDIASMAQKYMAGGK
jgi:hypothetical protein